MAQKEHLTGVILEIKDFRDNDKIISFYSRQLGKVEILIRGARKITSKLAPIISEPFALLELIVAPGKSFYHLIGGEVKIYFKNILCDYVKIIQISDLLARINQLINPKKPDAKIIALIIRFLEKINQAAEIKVPIINYAFLIKFLSLAGYRPEIRRCLVCRQKVLSGKLLSEEFYFDLERGGLVCARCRTVGEHQIRINFQVLHILQTLLYKSFNFSEKEHFNKEDFVVTKNIIDKFLRWHLEV